MTTTTKTVELPDLADARDYLKSWGCLANPNVRMVLEQAEAAAHAKTATPVMEPNQQVTAARTGRELYNAYTDNHPTIHSNRFPAWCELADDEQADWNAKAKGP